MNQSLIIAVDFDGTIVEHAYPAIGEVQLFAFETMKELQKRGHRLILWTYRCGKELDDAVEFCRERGIEFYAVNKNYPEEQFDAQTMSRKVNADWFIDDRNIGGFLGWSKIWQLLTDQDLAKLEEEVLMRSRKKPKRGFFSKLFNTK